MVNKLKIEDAGKIVMPAGKILVEQLKERKHMVTRTIPKPVDEQAQPTVGKDGRMEMPVQETEEVKQREPYYIQFFRVVSAPKEEIEYPVGTIVLASAVAGATFDLINKTKVLNKFEIIGKYDSNN